MSPPHEPPQPFTGIPIEALDFFEGLEADNSKAYWQAHRDSWETSVRDPIRALADALSAEFGPGKHFRPYRDVRFSKDKSPYKTHQGVAFGDGRSSALGGAGMYYLHVSAAGLLVAGGFHDMARDQVQRYRSAVEDERHGPALERVIAQLRTDGLTVDGERLATRPRGADPDHPRLDLLRHKTLYAWTEPGAPPWLETPEAVAEVTAIWRRITPLNHWLAEHVGPSTLPMR